LNTLYRESVQEADILDILDGLFGSFAATRQEKETFGNFLFRTGALNAVIDHRENQQ
jgi:sulfite reductase (NADPH) hemoprotein beta-component